MTVEVQVSDALDDSIYVPDTAHIERWALAALKQQGADGQLSVRIVDGEEARALNRQYRGKDMPTNVLSFPLEAPGFIEPRLLGDIVICAPVVAQEASGQGKQEQAHWAHMLIHGVLHLLGYDHDSDEEAKVMESAEVDILSRLGFADPYQ